MTDKSTEKMQTLLVNFHNCLLQLSGRLSSFFAAHGELQLGAAVVILTKKGEMPTAPTTPGRPAPPPEDVTKSKFWAELILPLKLYTDCERAYYEMSYLKRPNEDVTVKYMYAQVSVGIKKIMAAFHKLIQKFPKYEADLGSAMELLRQVRQVVQCRLTLIPLYQSLAEAVKPPDYFELVKMTEKLTTRYELAFEHPALAVIKKRALCEILILKALFRSQLFLMGYKFKDCMLALTICRHQLAEWTELCSPPKRGRKSVTLGVAPLSAEEQKPVVPAFTAWANSFCNALVSKASLYFFNILQERSEELKEDISARLDRLEFNYYSIIEKFVKRTGTHSFNLIFDCSGLDYLVEPRVGYLCRGQPPPPASAFADADLDQQRSSATTTDKPPGPSISDSAAASVGSSAGTTTTATAASGEVKGQSASAAWQSAAAAGGERFEAPQGLKAWPAVFSYPNLTRPPLEHWPNLISIIMDRYEFLSHGETYYYAEKSTVGTTYLINRVEPRMYMALVYQHLKKRNEPLIAEVTALANRLRNAPVLASLSPAKAKKTA